MAKQRTYIDHDRKEYIFNNYAFKCEASRVFRERKESGEKISVFNFESEIGEYVCRSQDSVKKWKNRGSSPGDLEMVKSLAEFLGIDYHKLLAERKVKEVVKMEENKIIVDQTEKDVVKEICTNLMEYVQHIGDMDKLMVGLIDCIYSYNFDPLYKKLNMSVFDISEDTYNKLRRLIAEVQFALSDSSEEMALNNTVKRWTRLSDTYNVLIKELTPYDQDGNIWEPVFNPCPIPVNEESKTDTISDNVREDTSEDGGESTEKVDTDEKDIQQDYDDIDPEFWMFPSELKRAYGYFFFVREMEVEIDKYYEEYIDRYMTDKEAADSYSRLMVSAFIDVVRHDFPEYFTK